MARRRKSEWVAAKAFVKDGVSYSKGDPVDVSGWLRPEAWERARWITFVGPDLSKDDPKSFRRAS